MSTVFIGTAAAALFECMIITLIWMKTASIQRSLQNVGGYQRPRGLSYILLRQGQRLFPLGFTFADRRKIFKPSLGIGFVHFV